MMWKHNNFFIGALIAIVLTLATSILVVFLVPLIYGWLNIGLPSPKLLLLSIIPAILLMRHFFSKLQFNKSGNGVIVFLFVVIILYFLLIEGKMSGFPTF